KVVSDCNMVFVAVGMGGGTGTGAAPVVARLARDAGALTVGVVTKPFSFEGRPRMQIAEEGIRLLEEHVDTLITISNDRLLELCDIDVTVMDAFHMVDDVLAQGIQAISDVVNVPGEINVDFADVRNIMLNGGHALMAIGVGEGEDRVANATNAALASPLLESSIQGATGILFNISGGRDLTLAETNRAAELINRASNPDAIVIFGVVHDPELDGQVRITLIATGLTTDEDVEVFGTQQRLRFPSRQLSAGGVSAAGGNLGGPAGGTDGYGWSSLFKRQADRVEEQPFG
ncbi:MAG: cell division protein FtsZ, partial [Chloroflexi bacterium]|nr:cell division protein FtsZ [Chloroflexota bacterium]